MKQKSKMCDINDAKTSIKHTVNAAPTQNRDEYDEMYSLNDTINTTEHDYDDEKEKRDSSHSSLESSSSSGDENHNNNNNNPHKFNSSAGDKQTSDTKHPINSDQNYQSINNGLVPLERLTFQWRIESFADRFGSGSNVGSSFFSETFHSQS